jgi:hypothetical protein
VICWTLGSPLIHPLKSGIIALERPLVNPFQGWGCHGCQDLLRWKNLIFSLSDQHIPGDRLHLVMSRWKSKWAKVLMVTHRLIKCSSLSVSWLCAIEWLGNVIIMKLTAIWSVSHKHDQWWCSKKSRQGLCLG